MCDDVIMSFQACHQIDRDETKLSVTTFKFTLPRRSNSCGKLEGLRWLPHRYQARVMQQMSAETACLQWVSPTLNDVRHDIMENQWQNRVAQLYCTTRLNMHRAFTARQSPYPSSLFLVPTYKSPNVTGPFTQTPIFLPTRSTFASNCYHPGLVSRSLAERICL